MRLRILFLATRDWYDPSSGGGDEVMWEYARYLSAAGHEVTYVASHYRGARRAELIDGLHVVRLGRIHTLWLRSFLYYLAKGRGRVDVVVAEGFGGSRIPRLVPLYVKEPVLTEWHQVFRPLFAAQYPWLMNGPLNLLEWLTARISRDTLVRAGTSEVREDFIRLGFRRERVFVLPVSIREEWIDRPIADRVKGPDLIWIGKIRKYKHPDHVVTALSEVIKHIPGARLTIVGRHDDIAYEKHLQDLTKALDLGDRVEFRFGISDAEKRDLLDRSRVLILPSAVEGFGIVVLEANSRGVPVIASSGVPVGAVRDGVNGLRYHYGDVDALTGCICRLLADDGLHETLSRNAIAFAKGFGWRAIGERYAAVVQSLVVNPGEEPAQPQLEQTLV